MARLRDIRSRIDSIRNTQQVTRAMKMVAAAKLRRAQERIFTARPYSYRLREIISHLKDQLDPTSHEFFQALEAVDALLIVGVTAAGGLAGAFSSNRITAAGRALSEYEGQRAEGKLCLLAVGRKGYDRFAKRGYPIVGNFRGVFDNLGFQ